MVKRKVRYGPRGFTEKVHRVLRGAAFLPDLYEYDEVSVITYLRIPARALLEAAKYLPKRNLEDRHNKAPKLRDFIKIAGEEPRCIFTGYLVTKRRSDERLSIDGIFIPRDREDLVREVLSLALGEPDEKSIENIDGREYHFLWWD